MTDVPIEEMMNSIGQMAVEFAPEPSSKILLYAKVEDGVISTDLFNELRSGVVRFRFAPGSLREMVYAFWERWRQAPGNQEWRTMAYVIENGKVSIDLKYPEQVNVYDYNLRTQVVKQHFGEKKIDYSSPD